MNFLLKISFRLGSCFIILFLFSTSIVFSQKLPDQQEISLRAPANLKIDGKTTEWSNGFRAYNNSTSIFYTITNDDNNLYLVVQSTNSNVTNKIMRGGLTFTINKSAKKKEKDGVSIMFPVPASNDMMVMFQSMASSLQTGGMNMSTADPALIMKKADSIMYVMNRQQIDKLKDIKISGIKEITDTLISIYNDEGIKARALFDNKAAFTYELAIPLKYLELSTDNPKEFVYNIKLNGLVFNLSAMGPRPGGGGDFGGGGMGSPPQGGMGGGQGFRGGPNTMDIQSLISPTDFWGKYTLAKK